jgi:phosphatidylserine decarboxylase
VADPGASGGPLEGRFAPQALPGAVALVALGATLLALGWGPLGWGWLVPLGWLALGLAGPHMLFFRNPEREIPPGDQLLLSPADGKVVEIVRLEDPFVGQAWRIAIFLSVLDVHVNRAPCAGKLRALARSGSEYLAAFRGDASALNVQLRADLETPAGWRASVVQITGLIARRIVCYAREGDVLERGAPYGLICYGSRVELYLPARSELRVQVGERVRGGETVMAEVLG